MNPTGRPERESAEGESAQNEDHTGPTVPTRGQERTADVAPVKHLSREKGDSPSQHKLPLSEEASRVGYDELLMPTVTASSPDLPLIVLPLCKGPPVHRRNYLIGVKTWAKLPTWKFVMKAPTATD